MYAIQEMAQTAEITAAQTLESLYTGQSELYAHLKDQFGEASPEAERQHRIVHVVEQFCRLHDETKSTDAATILDAFANGSPDSQMLAAELVVHYVVYDVLEISTAARSLRTLLRSEDRGVFGSAVAAATFLRDCEPREGPYDELTQQCLRSPDASRSMSIKLDTGRAFLHVVPE